MVFGILGSKAGDIEATPRDLESRELSENARVSSEEFRWERGWRCGYVCSILQGSWKLTSWGTSSVVTKRIAVVSKGNQWEIT